MVNRRRGEAFTGEERGGFSRFRFGDPFGRIEELAAEVGSVGMLAVREVKLGRDRLFLLARFGRIYEMLVLLHKTMSKKKCVQSQDYDGPMDVLAAAELSSRGRRPGVVQPHLNVTQASLTAIKESCHDPRLVEKL